MQQCNQDDRLGDLPDSILLTILDRLNVQQVARISVLSRRWRQLPAMLSRLRITFLDLHPRVTADIPQTNALVAEATKSMLGRRDSRRNTIQFLCINFFLILDDCISIGHSVGHTMATQNVEIAEFTIYAQGRNGDDRVNHGRGFMLFFDACPRAFGGLTFLYIQNMSFGESDISNVLSTCKRLKRLRMFNCGPGNCTILQVEHSQLTELDIVWCYFERVVLNSLPKLTRIAFEGRIPFEDPINCGYVPLLEAVGLTNVGLSWHKMVESSKFLGDISVRELKLQFDWEKVSYSFLSDLGSTRIGSFCLL
jgi:hypothetical protein